ncbi:sigma-70 family RNA polymerase sigma factor [Oscillibacter sp.]|uniref:RNA polymerase sigma factor n=1 Tax=Oscillibacter sp. TaxID=1945593 RepID=UPI00289D1ED8|nr:sigma-70 family RNA polymerase sigma factor [Oscillibacter sp.]
MVFNLEDLSDQDFIDKFSRDYERLMFFTVKKYTSNLSDQEDIVQDALIKLMNKVSVIRPLPCYILAGYVVSTIRNTAINYLKRQRRRQSRCGSLEDEAFVAGESPSLDELLILAEQRERLSERWNDLSEKDRILLEGKYIFDCTDEELAIRLNCKASNIRMRLSRARRRAMKLLIEREEGAGL